MPGVTVEVSSPALIEKTRSVVTDGAGQYRIVNLSPGIYTVTFTLAGFSTVKREGIQLSTDFTATVNAELKVGSLEETITVSGVVAARRRAVDDEADRAHARGARHPADAAQHPGGRRADSRRHDVGDGRRRP